MRLPSGHNGCLRVRFYCLQWYQTWLCLVKLSRKRLPEYKAWFNSDKYLNVPTSNNACNIFCNLLVTWGRPVHCVNTTGKTENYILFALGSMPNSLEVFIGVIYESIVIIGLLLEYRHILHCSYSFCKLSC